MDSFAFRAVLNGNDPIAFPADCREKLQGKTRMAKIIVLFDEEDDDLSMVWKPEKKEFKFDAFRIDTKGFRFNREEANER